MADGRRRPSAICARPLLPACGGLLLVAVDHCLEVSAGPELGHGRLGHLDGRTGGWVPGSAGWPVRLLEYTEAGNCHLVALSHCALDSVENRVYGLSCGFLITHPTGNRVDQVTLVHVLTPAVPHSGGHALHGRSGRAFVTSNLLERRRCRGCTQ